VVYAAGACRTIYVGDSGELVTAVHVLGIPHPSGYPLYVLLGKLWTILVPVGSIAFRMSLFSAACAATATGILHALGRRAGLDPVSAVFSSLLFAFSPSFWGEANVQRVYALNALFVALTTAVVLSWHRSRNTRQLFLALFLSGLGATNHTFMVIYGIALAAFALMSEPELIRKPRALFLAAFSFGAGLLPYLYLPLRSRADPPLDWGNPESLASLLRVILRWDFWERAWIESPPDLFVIAADYLLGLGRELFWAGAFLAIVGALAGWRRGWPVVLALLVMAGNFLSLALHGSRSDIFIWHRYYIPSYLMAAMLAGVGCQELLKRLPRRAQFLPLAVPALAVVMGWSSFDRSRYRIADDFSRTLLQTLPPGAHLSATDDNILFVLIYLHFVERLRPDVDLILQGVGEAELPPLKFDPDTDPLFFTHHPNWSIQGLEVLPVGLVFQTVRSGRPWPPPVLPKTELEGELDPRVPKDYLTQNLIGQFHFMLGSTFENRDWAQAVKEFEAARKAAPDNDVLLYNLGLIYRRNGLYAEALADFERSHEINPRQIASRDRVRAADRVLEVGEELERLRRIEASLALEPGIAPGTAAYHERMAQLLDERGEMVAARGHWLRAAQSSR
jgi:tetratricopeptide (TPR) repeat protein